MQRRAPLEVVLGLLLRGGQRAGRVAERRQARLHVLPAGARRLRARLPRRPRRAPCTHHTHYYPCFLHLSQAPGRIRPVRQAISEEGRAVRCILRPMSGHTYTGDVADGRRARRATRGVRVRARARRAGARATRAAAPRAPAPACSPRTRCIDATQKHTLIFTQGSAVAGAAAGGARWGVSPR